MNLSLGGERLLPRPSTTMIIMTSPCHHHVAADQVDRGWEVNNRGLLLSTMITSAHLDPRAIGRQTILSVTSEYP